MKQFSILVFLLLSMHVFSQTSVDSVLTVPTIKSVVIQKIDSAQIMRIDNIEQRLAGFYTQTRRAQALMYIGAGLAIIGSILDNGESSTGAMVLPLTGAVVSIFGTVIYLDSYKFLKFKPKRKQLKAIDPMTYY